MRLFKLDNRSDGPIADSIVAKWFDARIAAATRWMLASTALVLIYMDPSQPDNDSWEISYVILAVYMLYSSVLYLLSVRRARVVQSIEPWAHWMDVAWFTVLTSLCSGTFRIFFFGYLFVILIASFRRGFAAGFSVVIVSMLSYTIIGYSVETASPNFDYGFDVYRFLLRPVYLLVLGYLIAYWGGQEIMLKRRLALLKDITLSNPRFGVDRTINSMLERLRDFLDADVGLMITRDARANRHLLYRSQRLEREQGARPEAIASDLAGKLLSLPENLAVCFNKKWRIRKPFFNPYYAYNVLNNERVHEGHGASEALSTTLDDSSFITVPLFRHSEMMGRMYFSTQKKRSFDMADVDFLLQVIKHVDPVIENIRLVDRLASDAAEQERRRIARDIHDSVIQPYIGFQIGLSGIRRKLAAGRSNMDGEIDRLLEMTTIGIADLRQYVGGLQNSDSQGNRSLLSSVQRFTSKFSGATGIEVKIEAKGEISINDGLAAEAFQIIAEGLSNIRRHTEAQRARVGIECSNGTLTLRIENDCPSDAASASFTPRSITERASSLGGQARVEKREDGGTVVSIEIPL